MKIISSFKDYYDYVAHVYGQDNSIVYTRNYLTEPTDQGSRLPEVIRLEGAHQFYFHSNMYESKLSWLCFCGKPYPLFRGVLADENTPEFAPLLKPLKYGWFRSDRSRLKDMIGIRSRVLVELSKQLNAPVFTFTGGYPDRFTIQPSVPKLGEIGFVKILSAEQAYQELSYFLGNEIHDSPDLAQPFVITDKEKIVSHGFDMKQSFRHRK